MTIEEAKAVFGPEYVPGMEDLPCNSKLSVDLSKFRLTKEEVDARLGEGGADDEDPMEDDDEYEEAGGAEDKGVTERGE